MWPALQILDAPFTGVKCFGPQAARLIQRHAQIITKRGTGAPFHPVLPIAYNPFSGNIGRLCQNLFHAGSGAGLQPTLDSSSLLSESRNPE